MSKKIISLAVAILMIAALIPATFAAESGSASVAYKFDNLSIGVAGNTSAQTITDYSQTNNTWKFYKSSRTNAHQLKNTYLAGDTRAAGEYIAFNINVPEAGTYAIDYTYAKIADRGSVGDVYLVPAATFDTLDNAIKAGVKIASVDYSNTTGNQSADNRAELLVDTAELVKGDNILLLVATDKGANAIQNGPLDYFTYPVSLTLTPVTEVTYTFDNLSIGVAGNTVISTITSYDQTGNLWRYFSASSNARNSQLKNGYLAGDTRAEDHYIALEINVPYSGKYVPQYFYQTIADRGGKGDVYLLPEGGFTNLAAVKANGTKIASVDYSASVNESNVKANMLVNAVELQAGTNVLALIVTGKGDKAKQNGPLDYFTYPAKLRLRAIEIYPEPSEDEELTDAFDVTTEKLSGYVAPTVVSVTVDGSVVFPEKNSDGSYDIAAPEKNSDGESFLYWAKGLNAKRRIISFSNVLESYVPDENGANILIAIYDNEGPEAAEYYNANGQLIAKGDEPTKPSMAGYGTAIGWTQYNEKNIYVAEYELISPKKNVEITVSGGTGSGTYAYGDTVTCKADTTKENFKCWIKSGINGKSEIVSVEKSYKFKAWESCTVTAVYEKHLYTGGVAKIVLDTFTAGNETAIMAEFIGLDNAVEKGIMCGDSKIAMTKPGNQFTVVADKAGTYTGYAIVSSDDGYVLITDGSVE